jgi:hypothetical protein
MSKKDKLVEGHISKRRSNSNSAVTSQISPRDYNKSTPPPSFDLDDIIRELPVAQMFEGGRRPTSGSAGDSGMSNTSQGRAANPSLAGHTASTIQPHSITAESIARDPNYMEISKSEISNLPKGAYLRYVDINNVVKPGGKLNAITTALDGEVLLKFGKYNVASRKYFAWSVRTGQISKLYKYITSLEEKKVPIQPRSDKSAVSTSNVVSVGGAAASTAPNPTPSHDYNTEQARPHIVNPEDQFLNQLGGKILLDNGVDELKSRVSAIETAIEKLDSDLKKLFILVKRIYKQ